MSRIIRSQCEKRVQDSAVEDPIGKRDPVRSIDYVRVSKLKIVVDGETIYEYGREEE